MISKKITNKKVQAIILSAMLSTVCATTAFAAEETKVVSIPLEIVSNIDEKENITDVDIKTSSKLFEVTDYTITNEPSKYWDEGDKPTLKIKLEIDDDDVLFDTELDEEDITITLTSPNTETKEAKVTKVIRSGKHKAYVYVTLPAVGDGQYELDIPKISWDEKTNKAYWEAAEDATSYELKLFRDNKLLNAKTITTKDIEYDFSEYFTEEGEYQYKIRALYNKSNKGEWSESDELEISKKEIYTPVEGQPSGTVADNKSGTWVSDANGWWWLNADRTWPKNEWKQINNKWYYFNNSGYMHTGWIFTDGNWYFLSDNGEKAVNTTISNCKLDANGIWVGTPNTWFKWGDDWYYFGKDGKPVLNQWVQTDQAWFYCGQDGRILKNTTTPDGYRVDAYGAWIE